MFQDVVKGMVKKAADVNVQNVDGHTTLMFA